MANKIQLRRDTAGNWTNTIVLSQGEIGVEWDTGRFKLGDGTSNWGQLDYFEPGAGGGAGGGLSISDFGLGFTDALDAGKITTSKLYNENPNPGLNNQYTLEVTNGGVVALPDGSIINGATLKSVAGNYAGITAGPAGHDEDSWMWVDSDGAWISTDSSDNNHTWKFQNDGKFILPVGGDIVASDGVTSVLGGGGSSSSLVNGSHTVSLGSDGKLTVPGEIKSQAGVGDVVIEANNGTAKTWTFAGNGYLNLPGGTAFIVAEGNAVSIGANGEPGSSSLDLTSLGAGLTSQVDLRLSAGGGAQHWEFGTDGALTLPSGASISNVTTGFNQTFTENGSGGSSTNQDSLTVGIGDPAWAAAIAANPGNYYIRFASEDYLGQSTIGAISGPAPGTNVYTLTGSWSADGGGFPIIITSNDYVSVTDINSNSGARITTDGGSWTFDTYGVLTLPGVPSPNFFGDHGTISYRPSEWQAVQTVGSTIPGVNGVGGGGTWKFNKTLYEFDFTAIKPGDTLMLDNADVGYSDPPGTRGYAAGITVSYQDPDNQDLWIIGSSQAGPNLPDGTTMWLRNNDESISLNDSWGFSNSSISLPYNAKFKRNEHEWTFGDDGTLELPASLKIGPISDIPTIYSTGSNLVVGSYNDLILSAEDGDYDWTFGQDGSLTLPNGAGFVLGESGQLKTNDGTTLSLDFRDQSGRGFYTNSDGYTLRSNGTYNRIFGTDGSTTLANGVKFDATDGNKFALVSSTISAIDLRDDHGRGFYTDNGGTVIRSGTSGTGWLFGADNKLTFPDGRLTIEGSVIGRRVESGSDGEIDAVGAKLTVTDNSIAMEGYADPYGANNKAYGRVVAGTGSTIVEYIVQDVAGETGSRITVGGNITMYVGDGVINNTWNFDTDGQTFVPSNVLFANNKSLTVTNTISELEQIYTGLQSQLNDQFYSLLYGGAGYPWGITVPLTWNSYDEFVQLSPDTIPGEGVQINITVLANNTKQAYLTWQESFADTKITVDVNGGFVFAADNSLTFPNAAIIRESTNTEVTTAKTAYTRAIATWEYSRITDYLATVNAGLATLQGHPFAGWDDVSGTTAQAYLDIVNNAWNVQNAPSSPPQQLIFVPPITASLRSQLRSQLQSVINTYATYQTLSTSVDIVAGSEKISLLGNNKIEVPGIVQTTPEEDIVIRTRYAGASSPPGTAIYTNQDFTFGTNGTLTFPDNTIQTTAYQKVSVPIHSYGATGDKVGMVAFDGDYIYYCKQNYVNNSTDIWVRVAWTGTSW
jgi:hypothetical protein